MVVSEFAEVLRESYWAQENTLAGVLEEAAAHRRLFEENQDVADFVALVNRSVQIPTE